MMNIRIFFGAFVFLSALICSPNILAQKLHIAGMFSAPLDSEIILAGTFGEIRTNHFHSGIDITTSGEEGKKVFAAAGGYVSRIKVSAVGFGKALYITHPNGFVTVYGHLQRFNDTLEKYVRTEQYKKESFEVEMFPGETEFVFNKGDLIAFSGNTGGSSGPHLHFEIRDGKTEEPMEPLSFGLSIVDSIAPEIKSIIIYSLHNNGMINDSCIEMYDYDFKTDGKLPVISGETGFGIEVSDLQGSGSLLGIKKVELIIDKIKVYDYSLDRFRFDESRYVNACIDYSQSIARRKTIMLCYQLPGNNLRAIRKQELNGVIYFTDTLRHDAVFRVTDFNNNTSEQFFSFLSTDKKVDCKKESENDSTFLIEFDKPFVYETKEIKFGSEALPSLYDDAYITISKIKFILNFYSYVFHIGNSELPIHNLFNLRIKPYGLIPALQSKALIVKIDSTGDITSAGGNYENGFVTTKINTFGNYAVAVDTFPPVIKATNLSTRGKDAVIKFKIKIKDDLSGIATYRATLNKKWMLMEYDAKTGTLTGEEKVTKKNTTYRFELVVTDKKGNRSTHRAVMSY